MIKMATESYNEKDENGIVLSGWLTKFRRGVVASKLEPRYFVINRKLGTLCYYLTDEKDAALKKRDALKISRPSGADYKPKGDAFAETASILDKKFFGKR